MIYNSSKQLHSCKQCNRDCCRTSMCGHFSTSSSQKARTSFRCPKFPRLLNYKICPTHHYCKFHFSKIENFEISVCFKMEPEKCIELDPEKFRKCILNSIIWSLIFDKYWSISKYLKTCQVQLKSDVNISSLLISLHIVLIRIAKHDQACTTIMTFQSSEYWQNVSKNTINLLIIFHLSMVQLWSRKACFFGLRSSTFLYWKVLFHRKSGTICNKKCKLLNVIV